MIKCKEVTFRDIAVELSDGLHAAPKFFPEGEYIFVNAKNIVNGRIVDVDPNKKTSYEEYLKYKIDLDKNTILYSIDGTIGNVAKYRGEKVVLGKGACYIKLKPEVDSDYIFFYLQSPQFSEYIRQMSTGSTIRHISLKTMRNHKFCIPDILIQKRIACILSSLQNEIDNNNLINENLLQQAGAVFDKFYNASPDQQPFTSLINVLGGGTPKTGNPEFWDGPIPFFTPKDVGAPYTFQTEKYITESGLAHCNSRLYQKDTTFVTARGTVGKVSLAGTPMAMNQSCYALASETADPLLVYFYVLRAVDSLKHKASGAVFDAIVTRDFDSETINILSDDDSKLVLSIIRPIMDAIHNNSEENMRLVELRDSLLPKLMSGEMDVSELDI